MKFLSGLEPVAYAAFRIVVGFLFMCHGAQKLFGAFGGHPQLHNPLLLAAAIIEFAGGILVLLGLLTRFAALICSGEMAVICQSRTRENWPLFIGSHFSLLPVMARENLPRRKIERLRPGEKRSFIAVEPAA